MWAGFVCNAFLFPLVSSLSPVLTENSLKHPGPIEDLQTLTKECSRKRVHSATEELELKLGIAADVGDMPSFADPGSRSGYALDFLACRTRRLADTLLIREDDDFLEEALFKLFEQEECRVVSIGGGPGFDYLGICLTSSFMNRRPKGVAIKGTVFDYEPGWRDLVETLDQSTSRILSKIVGKNHGHSCDFGGICDITKSMDEPSNHGCRKAIDSTDVFVCQYCVAENANRLHDSSFVFFRDLLEKANEGSLFIITETTHRLWPDFIHLVREGGFDVALIKNRSLQLIIRKRRGAKTSATVQLLCSLLRKDASMHTVKLNKGTGRQFKKVRGSKEYQN